MNQIEQWLEERGVAFSLIEVDIEKDIDKPASRHNQVRTGGAIDPDKLAPMVKFIKRSGSSKGFPPLVGWSPSNKPGDIELMDGNHRHEMALIGGLKTFPLYLCECSRDVAREMSYEANQRLNGHRNTAEENQIHAVHLVVSGTKPSVVAERLGLTTAAVNAAVKLYKVDNRLSRLGPTGLEAIRNLSPRIRARLSALVLDASLAALCRAILDKKLPLRAADLLVPELNALRSEAEQLARIEEMVKANASTAAGSRGSKRTPKQTLSMLVPNFLTIDPDLLRAATTDDIDRSEMRQKLKVLAEHIDLLDAVLQ